MFCQVSAPKTVSSSSAARQIFAPSVSLLPLVFWSPEAAVPRHSLRLPLDSGPLGFSGAHLWSGLYLFCSLDVPDAAADCLIVASHYTLSLHYALPIFCNRLRNELVPRCFARSPLRKQFLQARPPDKSLSLRYLFYLSSFGHQRPQSLGIAFDSH